jgi:hypothetical protein
VDDNLVPLDRRRALDDIESRRHGGSNPLNGCVGISGLHGIYCFLAPSNANLSLNSLNRLLPDERLSRNRMGCSKPGSRLEKKLSCIN